MSIFSKIFGRSNNPNSYAFRLEKARSLHGQVIKYVTERRNDNDDVIGTGGSLCLHGDDFIVDSSGDRLFSCKVKDLEASNLMSGDGVVIKGPDALHDNVYRSITVHFVNFYRR